MYKKLYEENFETPWNEEPKIPMIIHQLWSGKKKAPPVYSFYSHICEKVNSNWTVMRWNDDNVSEIPGIDMDLYWSL